MESNYKEFMQFLTTGTFVNLTGCVVYCSKGQSVMHPTLQ